MKLHRVGRVALRIGVWAMAGWMGLGPGQLAHAGAYEGGISLHPQVAMDAGGNFVIVWSDRSEVLAQRHDREGSPLGEVIAVNADFPVLDEPADVLGHAVSMDADGRFVVVWENDPIERGTAYRLYGEDDAIVAQGALEFRVRPDVAMAPSGSFVVSGLNLTEGQTVASVFDAMGGEQNPVIFASAGPYRPWDSAVALNDAGNLYVAFEETRRSNDVVVGGLTVGGDSIFQEVLTAGALEGRDPDVATDSAGNVATVWEARDFVCIPFRGSFSITNVYLNVHRVDGEEILPGTKLNAGLLSADADPVVAIDETGTVTVAFAAGVNEVHQILVQSYRLGEEFEPDPRVISNEVATTREKRNPSIAVRDDGRSVVAWESLIFENGELTKTQIHFRVLSYEGDQDRDGVADDEDNCPDRFNPSQFDLDLDGIADGCDQDLDGDMVVNSEDNCPRRSNADQVDSDFDSVGDACDNCSDQPNEEQSDCDLDGIGNPCDPCFDGDRCATFERGDANVDGEVDLSDGIVIVNHLFLGASAECRDALDADDDGILNITDAIFLLNSLFLGGTPLPQPSGALGVDPTPDDGIGCCVCEQFDWLLR